MKRSHALRSLKMNLSPFKTKFIMNLNFERKKKQCQRSFVGNNGDTRPTVGNLNTKTFSHSFQYLYQIVTHQRKQS